MTPRYAVDASSVLNPQATGIGRYTRGLLLGLEQVCGERAPAPRIVQLYRAGEWRHRGRLPRGRHLSRQIWHRELVPRHPRYAAVLCPQFRMPAWPGVARVGVIHDIHPVLGLNQSSAEDQQRSIADLRRYVGKAQYLVFVSHHSRQEFFAHFEFPQARTRVIHHGVGAEFRPHGMEEKARLRQRYGLQRPYFLWSGAARPNKNLPRLLRAFAAAGMPDHELLISGDHSAEQRAALLRDIAALGLEGRVRLLGYVPDADIPPLFAAAGAYLFPSLHEGFGMPILEAMASGTPVLTSSTTACPEAAGGHAELVDPESVEDIARGIRAVAGFGAQRIEAARAYAASMTWARSAGQTLDLLEQAGREGAGA